MACTLRIIFINDVYELDLLPNFATAREMESKDVKTIGVLGGDFVAPSLLSSLDKGYGMVECMGACGIDFCCIGNHEDDIPYSELLKRMRESSFTWINSNMRSMPLPKDLELPEYSIVDVRGSGDHSRRVAFIGLNTDDPALYRKGSFGGATIEPLNEKAIALYKEIFAREVNIDAIVPVTHQSVALDRMLATNLDVEFPLILGGHDHEPYLETIGKCTVVKTGSNAQKFAICDITWPTPDALSPHVTVTLNETSAYAPKQEITALVDKHHRVLFELEKAVLCPVADLPSALLPLSSVSTRLHPSTMGTFLCELIKEAVGADCVLLNSGNVRGNHLYESDQEFTYADLKNEVPFATVMAIVNLPGHVIADSVAYSRQFALQSPPVEKGCFLQSDAGLKWDSLSNTVMAVNGKPLDREGVYRVAIYQRLLDGIDNIEPLLAYKHLCSPSDAIHAGEDMGIGAKEAIVAHFSYEIWSRILHNVSVTDMDTNADGMVTKSELKCALKAGSLSQTGALVFDNAFRVADTNCDGMLSTEELVRMAGLVVGSEHISSNTSILRKRKNAVSDDGLGTNVQISTIADEVRNILFRSGVGLPKSSSVDFAISSRSEVSHDMAIDSVIRELDTNVDGCLSENEIKQSEVKFVETSSKNVVI